MRYVLIHYTPDGTIVSASVQEVQNADTYQEDGYWVGADGRQRPLMPATLLFEPGQPWLMDVLEWWRDGKYYVDQGAIYQDATWQAPTRPEVPDAT